MSGPPDTPQVGDIRAPLLEAMSEGGYSIRSLARELQRRHPRNGGEEKGWESWRNTINRYTTENEERRQVPDEDTAALLSEILGKPAVYFVRRQERKGAREKALEQERDAALARIAELEEELARLAASDQRQP